MREKPRLLFISPRFLFPADEGGKIRTSNILRQMKGGAFHITLAMPAPLGAAQYKAEVSQICDEAVTWPATAPSRLRRVLALASDLPVSVALDRSEAGRREVAACLARKPDVVITDFPHASVLAPARIEGVSLLFTHNVETEIYERHAKVARGVMRLIWADQARKMERFEAGLAQSYNGLIAVSSRDAKALRERFGARYTPEIVTGVDLEYFAQVPPPNPHNPGSTVVFTGVMDSPANIDGIEFLLREIWPRVVTEMPQARAVIAGRNPPEALVAHARAHAPSVQFTGSVPDIRPYIAGADLAIIPLRVGGGTRIKAFESMAMGRPVVSTAVGIEGLGLEPGVDFLQADDAALFAAHIIALLREPARRETLASHGRALLEQRFSWAHVARQFETICQDAMRRFGSERAAAP